MDSSVHHEKVGTFFQTHIPLHKYTFKWKFENYSGFCAKTTVQSPNFYPVPGQAWYVEFEKQDSLYIYLCCKESTSIKVQHETSITDSKGRMFHNESSSSDFNGSVRLDLIGEFPNKLLPELDKLVDDVLLITCTLKVYNLALPTTNACSVHCDGEFGLLKSLSDDLKNIYEKAVLADVILKIDGVNIEVHKAILSARSVVFAKMFEQKMCELEHNVVDITDIDLVVMRELVAFMYTGVMGQHDFDKACQLYYAADKYSVLTLREACGNALLQQLQVSNAFRVLSLADRHGDKQLKDNVMRFVSFHLKPIMQHASWNDFLTTDTKLAAEIIQFCSNVLLKP